MFYQNEVFVIKISASVSGQRIKTWAEVNRTNTSLSLPDSIRVPEKTMGAATQKQKEGERRQKIHGAIEEGKICAIQKTL